MNIKLNNNTIEINANLNVAFKLQERFQMPYMKVIEHITTKEAKIDEQIKFCSSVTKRRRNAIEQEFESNC